MILTTILIVAAALELAFPPALLYFRCRRNQWFLQVKQATEEAERLKLQLETGRYRQARLSHQLTLLGQFTAGFMHEFNNPLAIVTSRIEVLLEERKEDAALCGDLQQMLKETRYMGY